MTLAVLILSGAVAGQAPAVPLVSPGSEVTAALADAKRLHPDAATRTRYLTMLAVPPADRAEFVKVFAFWSNSLSRESELVKPRRVSDTLLAVVLDDYGWTPETWEKLGDVDPYFHVRLRIAVGKQYRFFHRGGSYGGQGLAAGWYQDAAQKDAEISALAPWLPDKDARELSLATLSACPIVRADWWIHQTATQVDRSPGYYDFLGLGKKEADFQKLIGADPEAARRVKKEIAAVVARSGVTLNNRAITRLQAITGSYWLTADYKTSKDKQNTLRLIDGGTEPPAGDASEQVGTLPNGLFAYWLQNAKGERQDTAPDFIASDGQAPGTDRRVSVGVSCVRCHEGVREIRDWMREVFRDGLQLASPDYEKLKRQRQLYLSDLGKYIKRDQADYAETLIALNGMKPAENAKAFAAVYARYAEQDRDVEDVARAVGCTPAELTRKLKDYAKAQPLDPVLAGLIQVPPVPIRGEHFEEVFPVLMGILRE